MPSPDTLHGHVAAAAAAHPPDAPALDSKSSFHELARIAQSPVKFRKSFSQKETAKLFQEMEAASTAKKKPKVWTFAEWLEDIDISELVSSALLTGRATTKDPVEQYAEASDELKMVREVLSEDIGRNVLKETISTRLQEAVEDLTEYIVPRLLALVLSEEREVRMLRGRSGATRRLPLMSASHVGLM
jgi:hypothetical protein